MRHDSDILKREDVHIETPSVAARRRIAAADSFFLPKPEDKFRFSPDTRREAGVSFVRPPRPPKIERPVTYPVWRYEQRIQGMRAALRTPSEDFIDLQKKLLAILIPSAAFGGIAGLVAVGPEAVSAVLNGIGAMGAAGLTLAAKGIGFLATSLAGFIASQPPVALAIGAGILLTMAYAVWQDNTARVRRIRILERDDRWARSNGF